MYLDALKNNVMEEVDVQPRKYCHLPNVNLPINQKLCVFVTNLIPANTVNLHKQRLWATRILILVPAPNFLPSPQHPTLGHLRRLQVRLQLRQ
jgi:hypothetical protein